MTQRIAQEIDIQVFILFILLLIFGCNNSSKQKISKQAMSYSIIFSDSSLIAQFKKGECSIDAMGDLLRRNISNDLKEVLRNKESYSIYGVNFSDSLIKAYFDGATKILSNLEAGNNTELARRMYLFRMLSTNNPETWFLYAENTSLGFVALDYIKVKYGEQLMDLMSDIGKDNYLILDDKFTFKIYDDLLNSFYKNPDSFNPTIVRYLGDVVFSDKKLIVVPYFE